MLQMLKLYITNVTNVKTLCYKCHKCKNGIYWVFNISIPNLMFLKKENDPISSDPDFRDNCTEFILSVPLYPGLKKAIKRFYF